MNVPDSAATAVLGKPRVWRRRVGAALWAVMTLLALQTALVSLRFLFLGPDVLYPEGGAGGPDTTAISEHFVFLLEERWLRFAGHFIGGPLALLVGPFQFLTRLRTRRPRIHRASGWLYAAGVAVGGVAGLILALGSYGGLTTHFGFGLLAVLWLWFTGTAVWHARHRRFASHRRWMVRSFALTFGAVTLRLYIPLLAAAGVPFEEIYQTVAWMAWVPNLIVAEVLLARATGRVVAAR